MTVPANYGTEYSATWPSLPKKHYNGLNQTKPIYIIYSNIQSYIHYNIMINNSPQNNNNWNYDKGN